MFPAHQESTSPSLLLRARDRDHEAWERIVSLYSPLILRWCRRWGIGAADAENVCQEVFLAVSQQLVQFQYDEGSSFRGWLRAIAHHKYVDFVRACQKTPQAVGGHEAHSALMQRACDNDAAPLAPTTEERMGERAFLYRRALDLIKNEYSDRDYKAFLMVSANSRSAKDVAAELDMSVNAVYLAKSRIRKRLREEFAHLIEDAD